jgi:ubiquinone biosynthesis monooxygenase Coq7
MRRLSPTDRFLSRLSEGLAGTQPPVVRDEPKAATPTPPASAGEQLLLDGDARRDAAGLMRINHAGEVAAQGLYLGQALTARDPKVREHLLAAAREEEAHLGWCEQRLAELDDRPSRLRPFWYGASYAIGAVAGLFGDRWSLGFVAETEAQVAAHLEDHLKRLPADDARSRAVVKAMRADETRHGREAEAKGGAPLPPPVRGLMRRFADVMKFAAYRF